ncbi:tRNA uridine-5-carboxymethylaminomethyl(34) synthesis GTPase MnmE [Sphingomonas sp.]|jgi:tRNA modification GTPase|uniref:tRNA uridine-5-carboxymethylaminomethyl(34) synthesis GTPase MnmE n=1 Tax=Sphingomonas sp. TaxID=28214 RepID=UPI002EDACE2F
MATIFAVSSGRPPAAIAVIRCSGPQAFIAATKLAGTLPRPRRASLRSLHDGEGRMLDSALVLCFPGPASATGEDLVEFHCHGGRAVVAAVERALAAQPGLRLAEPGEFTRRALENGRIDLLEAEGLADLLSAETEAQRIAAMAAAEGRLSARTRDWLDAVALLSARVEVLLDYAEEADVADDADVIDAIIADMAKLRSAIVAALAAPSVERLRDGIRIVIAGPPNAGKSTLLNLLAERDAAIVSPISGTTRDRIEAPVVRAGLPVVLIDTAGLIETNDPVEAIGVDRARDALLSADVLLWLGDDSPPRNDAIRVHARRDEHGRRETPHTADIAISAREPETIAALWQLVTARAKALLATSDDVPAMHEHQRRRCEAAAAALGGVTRDPLIVAENLAHARRILSQLLGIDATEAMLDALFGRFCLGK